MTPITFGRYQLLKRLAVGGMAEIYLAKLVGVQGFEKLVVIKRILPNLAAEPRFVQMFLDEARLAATLNHPNVVQIFELGEEDGSYFIAMEFIAGQDLADVMKATRQPGSEIPLEVAVRIIADAASALHYAHTLKDLRGQPQNLVHRDVTLSNILVTYSGQVKLVDFGIAKAESQQQKTQAGGLKGKYAYMSPEQIQNRPLDGRSDLFSLGICFYELLVGRRLFKRESELGTINDILEGDVPPPSSARPDIPAALDALVIKSLAKDRDKRFQTGLEFQQALDAWIRTQPSQASSAEVGEFMGVAFAEQQGTYLRVLSQLPTASPEQLATLLSESEQQTRRSGTGNTGSGTGSGSVTRHDDFDDDDPSISIRTRRKRNPGLMVGGGLALVAILGALGLVFGTRRTEVPTAGSIEVLSTPPGAVVRLDGAPAGPRTPATLADLPLGVHRLELTLQGYEPATREVTLDEKASAKQVSLELVKAKAAPGTLVIVTQPAGATVVVDGKKLEGVTPLEATVSAGQEHLVRASLAGHLDEAQSAEVASGARKDLRLELRQEAPAGPPTKVAEKTPAGKRGNLVSVELTSSPAADVSFNGQKLGRTPLTARFAPGKVSLRFTNPAIDLSCERTIEVGREGGKSSFTFSKGKVAFSLDPWADVYLSDKKLGTTPISPREFYEGRLVFRLVNSEVGAIKSTVVNVVGGKTTVVREWPP